MAIGKKTPSATTAAGGLADAEPEDEQRRQRDLGDGNVAAMWLHHRIGQGKTHRHC